MNGFNKTIITIMITMLVIILFPTNVHAAREDYSSELTGDPNYVAITEGTKSYSTGTVNAKIRMVQTGYREVTLNWEFSGTGASSVYKILIGKFIQDSYYPGTYYYGSFYMPGHPSGWFDTAVEVSVPVQLKGSYVFKDISPGFPEIYAGDFMANLKYYVKDAAGKHGGGMWIREYTYIIDKPQVDTPYLTGYSTDSLSLAAPLYDESDNGKAYFIVNGTKYAATRSSDSMTATITGLASGTSYSVQAYATNIAGDSYSSKANFSTIRILSSDATLLKIATSSGTATPPASGTIYTLTVPFETSSLTVYPNATDSNNAYVSVNGNSFCQSGTAFGSYPLYIGTNQFTIYVIAEDDSYKTYQLKVTRQNPPDPVVTVSTAAETKLRSAVPGYQYFQLDGTVSGSGRTVTVSAEIAGITKSVDVQTPQTGTANWSLYWEVYSDNIQQGTYTNLAIEADHGYSQASATWGGTLIVDRTAPSAPSLASNPVSWGKDNSTVTITPGTDAGGAGVESTWYSYIPGSWNAYSAPFKISNEGTTTVYAYTRDNVGNETRSSGKVYIDKTAPSEPYIIVNQTWSNSDVPVAIQNSYDGDSGTLKSQYSLDNGTNWIDGNSFTLSGTSTTTILARSIDKVGNIGNNSQATVKIDKVAPVITSIGGNPANWILPTALTLVVNASDTGGSGISMYSFDDGATWKPTNSKNYTANESGIKIKVIDNAGNISEVSQIDISKIDGTRPTFTDVTGNPTSWQNTDVMLTINGASDGSGSGITGSAYSFDEGSTWQVSPQKAFADNQYIRVKVRDAVGNIANSVAVDITKIDKMGPYIGVARNPSSTNVTNGDVTLSVNAEDYGRSGVAATNGYSFDGGLTWQTEATKTYTANKGGIVIKVKDNLGNTSTYASTIDITNIDKTKPTLLNGKAERTGGAKAAVSLTTNEAGQLFYKVVANDATAPTSSEVVSAGLGQYDISSGLYFFNAISGITNDSAAYDVYVVVKDTATNVSDPLKMDLGAYATSTDNGIMKYIMPKSGSAFDIQGYRNEEWAGTTNGDGFRVFQKIAVWKPSEFIGFDYFNIPPTEIWSVAGWEEKEVEITNINAGTEKINESLGVKINLSFVNEGKYVKVEYVLRNTSTGALSQVGLATMAKLPILSGSKINIMKLPDNRGFYVLNSVENSQINFIVRNDVNAMDVDKYVVSSMNYINTAANKWTQIEPESYVAFMSPDTTVNFGASIAYSWQNLSFDPGETKTFSVLIGLLPNNATTTLTVNDIGTVNCGDTIDLSGNITDTAASASGYDLYYGIDGGTRISLAHLNSTGNFSGLKFIVPELSAGNHEIKFFLMNATEGIAETANNVVTKTFTILSYSVAFDTNGGSTAPSAQTIRHGGNASGPTNPTKAYYSFDGWYKDAALTNRWSFDADTVTSALTLYAKWNRNYYTLSFDSQGGTGISDQAVTGGAVVGTLPAPTRDGYTFGEWDTQANGAGTTYTADTMYEAALNTTIYAIWAPKTYALHFDSQGGSSVSDKAITYAAMVGTLPANPEKTGYTFAGWYTKPNGEGNQYITSTNYQTTSDTVLYANWTLNSYTVTFSLDGGSSSGGGALSQAVSHGGIVRAPSNPVKSGYRFAGWNRETLNDIVANTTITAQYTAVPTYTISAAAGANGSISASPGTIYEGDSVTYTITPSSHYHVADVLVDSQSFGAQTSYTFTDITTNHAIEASFAIDTYTVTFEDADGNAVKTQTVSHGGLAVAPETHPIKTGFDANGWSPATSTAITVDRTFTAQYTAIPSYSIVATAGSNGSISPTGTTNLMRGQGKSYTITPANGYQTAQVLVNGTAQTDEGVPVASYTFASIASNQAISATFTPLTFTVTFKDYDGTILKVGGQNTQTISYGSNATAPTPSRTGYSFANWNKTYNDVTSNLEVKAQYKINQYNVTFYSTGANTVTPAQKVDYDSQIVIPTTPKKTGFIFAGWYKDQSCTTGQEWKFSGSADGTILPDTVTSAITLYPKWTDQEYIVSFIDYDETPISEQNVARGSNATAPADPGEKIINGQTVTFQKWSVGYTNITGNTIVKALYMATQHAIVFDWNYSGAPADVTVFADDTFTANAPVGYERTGYSFQGWYPDSAGEGERFDDTEAVTQGGIYYSKWAQKQYFVKFVDYAGKTITSGMVTHGAIAAEPTAPQREGYTFLSWDKSFNDVTSPLIIKALYEKLAQYTISTVSGPMGSVTPEGDVTVYQGTDKTFTINPITGFEVSKVLVDGATQTENGSPTTTYTFSSIKDNHQLVADYEPKTYTVTFVDYTGNVIGSAQTIAHGEAALAPSGPARTGYNFTGWDKATDNIISSTTITALYSVKKYTVAYNTGGADAISSILAEYGSELTPPTEPTRDGYSFGGWYQEVALSNDWNFDSDVIPASNIILYAKWIIKEYFVVFKDFDDSTLKAAQLVDHGSAAIPPTEPTGRVVDGQNRSFEGWSTDFNSVTGDLIIKALYVGEKHTVTFDKDYNDIDAISIVVEDSTKVTRPSDPDRTGYTFGGWYTQTNGQGTVFNADVAITSTAAYYAKWTIKSYSVSFQVNGGTSSGGGALSQTVNHGSAATAPSNPTKTGYRFTGWDKTFTGITGALTVSAQYSEIPLYTISAQPSTGGTISGGSSSVREGSNSAAFSIQASAGYTTKEVLVNGIPMTDGDGNPATSYAFSNVRKNSTVAASFEANTYTVQFDSQNGSTNISLDGKFGNKLTAPTTPIKTGYNFGGWYKDNAYNDDWSFNSDTIPAGNKTLYAKWNPNSYNVDFISYGAEQAVDNINISFGSAYGTLTTPTRSSDRFAGWWTGKYGTGTQVTSVTTLSIANNHNLYAKWIETTAPVLSTGPAIRSGDTLAIINFTSNEAGTYYYVIVADEATPPAIDTSGAGIELSEGTNVITYPIGLTSGAKDIYVVVKDLSGNVSEVIKIDIPAYVAPKKSSAVVPTQISVLVNGLTLDAGIENSGLANNGKTFTTVSLNSEVVQARLMQVGLKPTITIQIKSQSDANTGILTGQMVKDIETKEATLSIETSDSIYNIPASQINIDDVSNKLGQNVDLKDILVHITVENTSNNTVIALDNAATTGKFSVLVPPVSFNISADYNGKTVQVNQFNAYVPRLLEIPAGLDSTKITTGIVVGLDGSVRHVPTQIVLVNGKYYAKINSLTNSVYSVIWHPIEFTDTKGHWAKDAINDMGSRLVISGIGNEKFSPNRNITRAEFAAILVRGLGLSEDSSVTSFKDIKAKDWYAPFVKTAENYQLISGLGNGIFGPNQTLTREQAMTMIARAIKITGLYPDLTADQADSLISAFEDASKIETWSKEGIADCLNAGIVSGKTYTELAPKDKITRAEVATIIRRMLQKSDLI
jgi:uncharacterized repeat protein (TIGR02543 family)